MGTGVADLDDPVTVEIGVAGVPTPLHNAVAVVASTLVKQAVAETTTVAHLNDQRAKSATRSVTLEIGTGICVMRVILLTLDMQQQPPTPTRWTQIGTQT
jgi:hypothetical protein